MRQRLPMWVPGAAATAAVIALILWSFQQRWQMLTASPFPLGVDGYFYPLELRSLLERGELAYPTSPLAFYLLAPLAVITDPITGAKLGAALWGAAIAAPAYGVGARLGGSRGAGLVAAVLATTSVGSAYLTAEFVKNSIGLTVALAALWLALAAAERPSRGRVAAAIAGIAAAWAAHKMAAALVVAVAVPAGLAAATAHGRLRGRHLVYAIGAALLAAVIALMLSAAFPHSFLGPGDAALLGDLWSATPRWTAPALALPDGDLQLGYDALAGMALAALAVVARIARIRQRRRGDIEPGAHDDPARRASSDAAAWPILALAIAIGLPLLAVDDRGGLGFRLRIAAFVPAALSAAIAARAVLGRWRHASAELAAAAIGLALLRQPGPRLDGEVVTHPALVSAAFALRGRIPPGATLIVPERHIAFLVAWYTGAPVALRPEAVADAERYRLLPLHFIGAGSALDRALIAARSQPALIPPLGVHPRHPDGLVLVAEPTWRWLLDQLPPADRAHFAAWPTI